jgi:hypothetical protein
MTKHHPVRFPHGQSSEDDIIAGASLVHIASLSMIEVEEFDGDDLLALRGVLLQAGMYLNAGARWARARMESREAGRDPAITAIQRWRDAQAAVEAAEAVREHGPSEAVFDTMVAAASQALFNALTTEPISSAGLHAFAEFGRDASALISGRLRADFTSYCPLGDTDPRSAAELYFATLAAATTGGES